MMAPFNIPCKLLSEHFVLQVRSCRHELANVPVELMQTLAILMKPAKNRPSIPVSNGTRWHEPLGESIILAAIHCAQGGCIGAHPPSLRNCICGQISEHQIAEVPVLVALALNPNGCKVMA